MGTRRHWLNPFAEQTWGVLMFQLSSHYQFILVRSWCTDFMYIMEFSWNRTFGSEGKEQNWTEWEIEKPSRTTHSPSDPTGSSGTGMTLQKGSELNQNDHALISPSFLIISSWIWTALLEVWVVGGVTLFSDTIFEGMESQNSVSTAFTAFRSVINGDVGSTQPCPCGPLCLNRPLISWDTWVVASDILLELESI